MSQANDDYWERMKQARDDFHHNEESAEEAKKKGVEYHRKEHEAFRK